jgi:hypothetical protein
MCESHFKAVVLWEAFACIFILTIAGGSRHSGSECSVVAAEVYRIRVTYLHHMAIKRAIAQEHILLGSLKITVLWVCAPCSPVGKY